MVQSNIEYEDGDEIVFKDVDKKIVKYMIEMFKKADKEGRKINWNDFKTYCMSKDVPLILRVPKPVIDKCTKRARLKYYENSDTIQDPND